MILTASCYLGPILLGYDPLSKSLPEDLPIPSWKELPQHGDESQVKLDVDRAFVHYPSCKLCTYGVYLLTYSLLLMNI